MNIRLPSLSSPADRSRFSWVALRLLLAAFIAAHGWARLIADAVEPFGGFLNSLGFPMGRALAYAITAVEIGGSVVFAAGRLVMPLALTFASIYAMGIVLVHAKAGWFVVGLGRNGSEYSVLLIVCLLCVGLQHVKVREAQSPHKQS
jgi:putative oxidoreductase